MNTLPFQPNKQQLAAIEAGATKLFIIANKDNQRLTMQVGFQSARVFGCDWCNGKDPNCTDGYGRGTIWDIDCETMPEYTKKYSPLQPNQQYFVQEPHTCDNFDMQEEDNCLACDRVKFTVTDVRVKSVQDLRSAEVYDLNYQLNNFRAYHVDSPTFEQVHDSQYPTQPYSGNPHGFLLSILHI